MSTARLRVLIGGERTGTIRDAFIARGHDAMSCDLAGTPVPGLHHRGDWWEVMHDGWDLAIFHPDCTYMAGSGALNMFNGRKKTGGLNEERWVKMGRDAWQFWDLLERCPVERFAVENPKMLEYAQAMIGRAASQYVQPWMFGTCETKATGLWLVGLPPLVPTDVVGRRRRATRARHGTRWHGPARSATRPCAK